MVVVPKLNKVVQQPKIYLIRIILILHMIPYHIFARTYVKTIMIGNISPIFPLNIVYRV